MCGTTVRHPLDGAAVAQGTPCRGPVAPWRQNAGMPARTINAMLLGVDFSCAPSPRKPIVVARGQREGGAIRLLGLERLHTLAAFEALLAQPGPWLGGFDFPFGLPREFVDAHALGRGADAVITGLHQRCGGKRMTFRALVDTWGEARPAGRCLVHRATDHAGATSSSPLQTRYVPVGFMYFEGFARLVQADVSVPGLRAGDAQRVALEAYPGRAAHSLIGARSYKNSDSAERRAARIEMLRLLQQGAGAGGFGLTLLAAPQAIEVMVGDACGDHLDAVLCLMQAAWAAQQPNCGVPADADPVEGWIVGPQVQIA